ncbi:hypothetical protein IAG41_21535 [Sphingomonas sp. JC676]|uniref:hypothetical protein n=1 Tax=Sphingomonas sp. JC676 TaxID=2768065 RepID=UPI001657D613|nr:hypothetical protein [Sphingomonas sp. JC676]MBC9034983.1 hypothetical protein [Sphingomonas sp. JC676]
MRKGPGRVLFHLAASLVGLAAAPAAMAQAPEWRVMMEMGKPGDRALLLVDGRSLLSPTRDTRTVDVSSFYSTIQTDDIKPYNVIRLTYRFDCRAKTGQRIREVILHDDKQLSRIEAVNPMAPVKPGTLQGDLIGPVCSGNFSTFPRITAATPALERKRRFGR